MALSVGFAGLSLAEQLDGAGHGALVVHHGGATDTFGSNPPVARLRVDDFELVRALTGRRSREQITAFDWDGEFAPEHLVLTRFADQVRPDPLVE